MLRFAVTSLPPINGRRDSGVNFASTSGIVSPSDRQLRARNAKLPVSGSGMAVARSRGASYVQLERELMKALRLKEQLEAAMVKLARELPKKPSKKAKLNPVEVHKPNHKQHNTTYPNDKLRRSGSFRKRSSSVVRFNLPGEKETNSTVESRRASIVLREPGYNLNSSLLTKVLNSQNATNVLSDSDE